MDKSAILDTNLSLAKGDLMNFLLDIKTIFLIIWVGHLFAALLVSTYWSQQLKDKPVLLFISAKCVQGAAWLFLYFLGGMTDLFTLGFSNTLLFLGASLEILAILYLQQWLTRIRMRAWLGITSFNIIGFIVILFLYNEVGVRIAFASVGTAAIIALAAAPMISRRTASLLLRTMGGFYMIIIVLFVWRAISSLMFNQDISLFDIGASQSIALLSLYLIMIAGNTGFLLLLKQRSDAILIQMANYDELTQTLNRRAFQHFAKKLLAEHAMKQQPVTLLLFDVDQFKSINDQYGHDIGDQILQQLTHILKLNLREQDLLARYGGDEFAILLPKTSVQASDKIAEQIRQSVELALFASLPAKTTISIGLLTVVPKADTLLDTLYTSCDQALYLAKKKGRNCLYRGTMSDELNQMA